MTRRSNKGSAYGGRALFAALLLGLLDVTTNTGATALITSMLSVPHINPPPKDVADKRTPVEPTAFFVEIRWGEGLPHDVDIIVDCETYVDGRWVRWTVNFSQTKHGWLNLDRDDQGAPSVLNIERVTSTPEIGMVPSSTTCRVNAHLFNSHGGGFPLKGELIAIAGKDGPDEEKIAQANFVLPAAGDEVTVLAVPWDHDGRIIPEAVQVFPAVTTKKIVTAKMEDAL